ncbi:hypothetical protein AB1N83_010417, partial [Pleurotus pulmonarius]
AKPP